MKRLLFALAIVSSPLLADSALPSAQWSHRQLPDPRQEAAARALMETIRCIVCQGQSVADSDAELAGDMRALIRERIQRGERPEAIRAWLIDRYGAWVSFAPPVAPLTWPLYAAPLLLLVIGGLIAVRRIKRVRR